MGSFDVRVLPGGMVQAPSGQIYSSVRAYKEHLSEVEQFTKELAEMNLSPEPAKPIPHNFNTATVQNGLRANVPAFYETVQQPPVVEQRLPVVEQQKPKFVEPQQPPVVEPQQEVPLPDYRNLRQEKQQPKFMEELFEKNFKQSDPKRSVGERAQDFASDSWKRAEDAAGLNDSWAYAYVFKPLWNNTSAPVKGVIVGAVALGILGVYRSVKGSTVNVVVHNNHDYKALAEAMANLKARNPQPAKQAEPKPAPATAHAAAAA